MVFKYWQIWVVTIIYKNADTFRKEFNYTCDRTLELHGHRVCLDEVYAELKKQQGCEICTQIVFVFFRNVRVWNVPRWLSINQPYWLWEQNPDCSSRHSTPACHWLMALNVPIFPRQSPRARWILSLNHRVCFRLSGPYIQNNFQIFALHYFQVDIYIAWKEGT